MLIAVGNELFCYFFLLYILIEIFCSHLKSMCHWIKWILSSLKLDEKKSLPQRSLKKLPQNHWNVYFMYTKSCIAGMASEMFK